MLTLIWTKISKYPFTLWRPPKCAHIVFFSLELSLKVTMPRTHTHTYCTQGQACNQLLISNEQTLLIKTVNNTMLVMLSFHVLVHSIYECVLHGWAWLTHFTFPPLHLHTCCSSSTFPAFTYCSIFIPGSTPLYSPLLQVNFCLALTTAILNC